MKRITILFLTFIISFMFSACSIAEEKRNEMANNQDEKIMNDTVVLEVKIALDKILSAPLASSNPNDYVKEHQEEFNRIVENGNIAFEYFMNEFSHSNSNGLKEYIMALACIQIKGDENTVENWSSGRDWYEKYRKTN